MGDIVQGVEHLPEIYKILGSISSNTKAGRGDNYNKVSKKKIFKTELERDQSSLGTWQYNSLSRSKV